MCRTLSASIPYPPFMQVHPQRLHSYHGTKRQLLGNQAGQAPPAWRANVVPPPGKKLAGQSVEKGSKILLSKLPTDVGENEVEILFTKTVGPVKDVFIVYNSQGKSKGMAVVAFQRSSDAAIARSKYNGKIVDGRRPIKIEIIKDDDETPQPPPRPLSLLERIAQPTVPAGRPIAPPVAKAPAPQRRQLAPARAAPNRPPVVAANPKARLRQKKGPKRIKKSIAQLDQEMEDYRSNAEA